jgi:hypothetical protein
MLKRHYDLSEAGSPAVTMVPKALSPDEVKKAQQIRSEMKALEKELASLLGLNKPKENNPGSQGE